MTQKQHQHLPHQTEDVFYTFILFLYFKSGFELSYFILLKEVFAPIFIFFIYFYSAIVTLANLDCYYFYGSVKPRDRKFVTFSLNKKEKTS